MEQNIKCIICNKIHNFNSNLLTVYASPFNKIRLGKEYDGGYVICNIPNVNYSLLLSAGISDDISFEENFCDKYTNAKCLAYDGTCEAPLIKNKNIIFIKKNISDICNNKFSNLHNIINNNNNIFLKMDIESYEYKWFQSLKNKHLDKA